MVLPQSLPACAPLPPSTPATTAGPVAGTLNLLTFPAQRHDAGGGKSLNLADFASLSSCGNAPSKSLDLADFASAKAFSHKRAGSKGQPSACRARVKNLDLADFASVDSDCSPLGDRALSTSGGADDVVPELACASLPPNTPATPAGPVAGPLNPLTTSVQRHVAWPSSADVRMISCDCAETSPASENPSMGFACWQC